MGKSLEENHQNLKSVFETLNKLSKIANTTAATTRQEAEELKDQPKKQQHKSPVSKSHETLDKNRRKLNSDQKAIPRTATGAKEEAATIAVARGKRLPKRNIENNNNNQFISYYGASKYSNKFVNCSFSGAITVRRELQHQNEIDEKKYQLTVPRSAETTTAAAAAATTSSAISSIAVERHKQIFKCSSDDAMLCSSDDSGNSNRKTSASKSHTSLSNCCTKQHFFNSIKIVKSAIIQKFLQFIAMSSSRSSSMSWSSSNITCRNSCNLNFRKFLYITLLLFIYCTLLIRVSAEAIVANESAARQKFMKLTKQNMQQIDSGVNALKLIKPYTVPSIDFSENRNLIGTNKTSLSGDSKKPRAAAKTITMNTTATMTVMTTRTRTTLELGLNRSRRDAANVPDDDDDSSYHDDEFDEYDALIKNKSAKGKYIGAPCNEMRCESTLLHVTCDKETLTCGCAKNYPVQLGLTKGCDKPKKLGEQCFYDETCMYNDENSLCVQVRHNALCQCATGFHSVSYTKPTRRVFCTPDLKELTSDLPTLLGVTTGIAVLAGLICMVLHLFSKTKYPRHRNFGDANIPPPIMYSSDTGIPLIVQSGRPSSRSSLRSSGSIGSYGNRRSSSGGVIDRSGGGGGNIAGSSGGSKGILVSTSRTGSRRPSLASVHSTSSSVRSYSMMRFEKETQQKEIRQEMKLRLARLQHQQHMSQNRPQIIIGDALSLLGGRSDHGGGGVGGVGGGGGGSVGAGSGAGASTSGNAATSAMVGFSRLNMATPSPLTPNSTDELLPAVDELQEYPIKSDMLPMTSTSTKSAALVASATLTAVQEIATTSTTARAALTASEATTAQSASKTYANDASKGPLFESGAYIGPCSSFEGL